MVPTTSSFVEGEDVPMPVFPLTPLYMSRLPALNSQSESSTVCVTLVEDEAEETLLLPPPFLFPPSEELFLPVPISELPLSDETHIGLPSRIARISPSFHSPNRAQISTPPIFTLHESSTIALPDPVFVSYLYT